MNGIRKVGTKWYSILTLVFLTVFTSCKKQSGDILVENNKLSGTDIYKEIFFGVKDKSSSLANYSFNMDQYATDATESKALASFQKDLVEKISLNNPSFFDEFGETMKRGDMSEIKKELQHALKLTQESIGRDVAKDINEKQVNKIKAEFIKDNGSNLSPKETMLALKKQKYQDMFKSAVSAPANIANSELEEASRNKNVSVEVNYYVYLEIAAVVVAIIYLVIVLPATEETNVPANVGNENISFVSQQMIASIASRYNEIK